MIKVGALIDLTLSSLFFEPRIAVSCLPKPVSSFPPLLIELEIS